MSRRVNRSLTLRAPAKLNLTLEVLSRGADGYHPLRSVMVPVDLYDEISFAPSEDGFRFGCSDPGLAAGNLVERALTALGPLPKNDVHLHKRIPTQAGMGGGSSDAAAILLAAQQALLPAPAGIDYLGVARSLGSDVPFF